MARKHLLANPHKVTNDFWWYEENKGISICVESLTPAGNAHVKLNEIPWRTIRAALKRKDKKS